MTQQVGVRPGPVTAAQVIIRVLAVLAAIVAALMLLGGIIGLISGAAVASKASSSGASGIGGVVGGMIGVASGFFIVGGLVMGAFVALWLWLASGLGKASRVAQIVTTVLCGLDILWGLLAFVSAVGDRTAAVGILPALVMLAIPVTLVVLLWGPESSRRWFDGVPAMLPPSVAGAWRPQAPMSGPYPVQPAPMSPPVGFATPQSAAPQNYGPQHYGPQSHASHADDALTGPIRLPSPRCGTCQAELQNGWGFCGSCGAAVQPQRPVGA